MVEGQTWRGDAVVTAEAPHTAAGTLVCVYVAVGHYVVRMITEETTPFLAEEVHVRYSRLRRNISSISPAICAY